MRSSAAAQVRVVVADDHPSIRENLRYLLETEPGFTVLATAADGEAALVSVARHEPDVLVLDRDMPVVDGLEVVRRLRFTHPRVAVVLYTAEPEACEDAYRAGAVACVAKDDPPALLVHAIRDAAEQVVLPDLRRRASGERPAQAPVGSQMLADAIDRGEIDAWMQPLVELRGGALARLEVLSRWTQRGGRTIAPSVFIPLAEDNDLITPLTLGIVRQAASHFGELRGMAHDLRLGVNLSITSLLDETFFERLMAVLDAGGCPRDRIAIEITESILMREPAATAGALRRAREAGMRIEVDDFGTGYSSLGRLIDLPIDAVKIDRRFVGAMTRDHRSEAVVRACIALGHDLGLEVVAEGIEDRETWDLLGALGCDTAQGFYVGAAMRPGDLPAWLAAWERRRPLGAQRDRRVPDGAGRPVLVVDDEPAIVAMIRDVLEDAGFAVMTAANGAEALRALERTQPSVVLLDMQMPILDGAGFTRLLRDRGLQVPIVVMTAGASAERWAEELAADAHLSKPFDIEGLLGVTRRYAAAN